MSLGIQNHRFIALPVIGMYQLETAFEGRWRFIRGNAQNLGQLVRVFRHLAVHFVPYPIGEAGNSLRF